VAWQQVGCGSFTRFGRGRPKSRLESFSHTISTKKHFCFFYFYSQASKMSSTTIIRTEEIIAGEDGIKKEV